MNHTWGVYNLQGKLADGTEVAGDDRSAVKWFLRWRVDGRARKRTFRQKGHAKAFREHLITAKFKGWDADDRGWPIDPDAVAASAASATPPRTRTFEKYCEQVWYPINRTGFRPKNRRTHRDNMRFAIRALRYESSDPRLEDGGGRIAGGSLILEDLVADDVLRAISARRTSNHRTALRNKRAIGEAYENGLPAVGLEPERAAESTVRGFYNTMAMIIKAAEASREITHTPLVGTSKSAPKPQPVRMNSRIVLSFDEVCDFADAIAQLGPRMTDGRPTGEMFRSLVLAGGSLGPRPGELVAHRPSWIEWGDPVLVRFEETGTRVYDPEEGLAGLQLGPLKQRGIGDWREIPALTVVADALKLHIERGYSTPEHTWTGANGAALDWGNIMNTYWRPAAQKVFGGTSKSHLVDMTPKILRKSAITFWLEAKINPTLAAEWAGHSEDVMKRYYASRTSATFEREAAMLAASREMSIGLQSGGQADAS